MKIVALKAKLAYLKHQLLIIQKQGIKKALKSIAINIIFAIEKIEALIEAIKETPVRELFLKTPRKAWRAWVATITGTRDKIYGGFSKQFIEPISREFDKKGEISATFNIPINLKAIYQDSDGDFWVFENSKGDIKIISYQEVMYRFRIA